MTRGIRKLPGIGKRAYAPCGHFGEHVTATLIVCDREWCDGTLPQVYARGDTLPIYTCRHPVTVVWSGTKSCRDCGKVLRQ